MKRKVFCYLLVVSLYLTSCNSDEKQSITNCIKESANGKLLVGNEGNFNWGVGTLSLYDSTSDELVNDVFLCQNGEPAGNVIHSLYQKNDEVFVVVNNSRKIEVLDSKTLKRKRVIANLNSPRYVVSESNKLFISDLYNNKLAVLGSNATQPERFIPMFGWVEKLLPIAEKKVVGIRTFRMGLTEFAPAALLFIDTENEQVTDSLKVSNAITDAQVVGNYILLTTTNYNSVVNDSLLVFDLKENKMVAKTLLAGNQGRISRIAYSEQDRALYYVKYNIHKLAWHSSDPSNFGASSIALAKQQGQEFYALALPSAQAKELYIADVKNYTANSEILIFDIAQQKVSKQFSAGIISGSFLWIK